MADLNTLNKEKKTKRIKKIAVVQTGGCSAVINSTLAGIIAEAQKCGLDICGLLHGFEGLMKDQLVDLTHLTADELSRLRNTPAMFLGSSRMFLTAELFRDIPQRLAQHGIDALIMIGGNGTMYAADVISKSAAEQDIALTVLGSPKTVDNDIFGVEYSPGFGSAACYIAHAVRDISIDLESMKTFEQVRIIEVMGRSVGWLAAASALAQRGPGTPPHLIYLPEYDFDEEEFLQDVDRVYKQKGFAVAVIGEGIHSAGGSPIGANPFTSTGSVNKIYGGASSYLASLVSGKLHLKARAQDLTMAQRCFGAARSAADEQMAYEVGAATVRAMMKGAAGCMICPDGSTLPLADVGGRERGVPEAFYDRQSKQVTPKFIDWITPITGRLANEYLSLSDLNI